MGEHTDQLVIITPSRGRPQLLRRLIDAVAATAVNAVVLPCLDIDDPTYDQYADVLHGHTGWLHRPRMSLSAWTNYAAGYVLNAPDPPRFLASLGDDHIPRTPGWDGSLIGAIKARGGSGFSYGNDLFQGRALPTAWVASSDVVRALGWMMLPACDHMFVDTAVLALGTEADAITYCPDVVIEHAHPLAGKAPWDASYRQSNARRQYGKDQAAYERWVAEQLGKDAATVRGVMGR